MTHAQNMQNVKAHRDSTSRHRGVSWCAYTGRWRAVVVVDGRRHHIGRFDSEDEAAKAARDFRAEHVPFATA